MIKWVLIFFIFVSFLVSAHAGEKNYMIYMKGALAGKEVQHTSFLGYEPACYNGNPWIVREKLEDMVKKDIEKMNAKVWYNQQLVQIELSYINTKCLDEGESEQECANTVIIGSCE